MRALTLAGINAQATTVTVPPSPACAEAQWTGDSERESQERRHELRKAMDRQDSLLKRIPVGTGFSWLLDRQIMFHSRRMYIHDGPTDTMPSHDLAHLLVGAGSNLLWYPGGTDAEVRISEFNAVFLENLFSYAYDHVACGSIAQETILPRTMQYACWFVEKHYAPFPMPFDEAYRRFCAGINAEVLTNLSHYFFAQKDLEHHDRQRKGPWEMRLAHRAPAKLDAPAQAFQSLIRGSLQFMKARQNGPGNSPSVLRGNPFLQVR